MYAARPIGESFRAVPAILDRKPRSLRYRKLTYSIRLRRLNVHVASLDNQLLQRSEEIVAVVVLILEEELEKHRNSEVYRNPP